ncbi:MAG TPA: redoxin domain-containing protein [Candidatus Limnocylindrales bacterium]|nr:redoxin domain-containing protein [Candidatus Limnocylindrales bacterium]
MRVEKNTVRAPEIGRIWFNSPPLSMRQLRGRVVLVDFWDYTCVNCIRTLPYLKEWHARYKDKGLTVIGVHTPEFLFARYESNVERGIEEFGLTYPVVVDSNMELWEAFANRCWPSKYLIDGQGYLRYAHFGEGAYRETEEEIQELLREIDPQVALPQIMGPVRDTDREGAVCYQPSPELYLGHRRGRIGNAGEFVEDLPADYTHSGELREGFFYAQGRWSATGDHIESASTDEARITIRYSAAAVNLVMASFNTRAREVEIRQDSRPLSPLNAAADVQFRGGRSFIPVVRPRMYSVVDNKDFGTHTLEVIAREPEVALFAFTFTSCVDEKQ